MTIFFLKHYMMKRALKLETSFVVVKKRHVDRSMILYVTGIKVKLQIPSPNTD